MGCFEIHKIAMYMKALLPEKNQHYIIYCFKILDFTTLYTNEYLVVNLDVKILILLVIIEVTSTLKFIM